MPNWRLLNNDGSMFDFADYQGQDYLLVLFFRGAWCNLCKKQLVDFAKHLPEFGTRRIKLVALSPDSRFKSSLLKTFLKLPFPVLSDEKYVIIDELQVRDEYQGKIAAKPAIFLYHPDHSLLYRKVGANYEEVVKAEQVLQDIEQYEIKPV